MAKFLVILTLGVALFFAGIWALGIRPPTDVDNPPITGSREPVRAKEDLGADLYAAAPFKPIQAPKWKNLNPIVVVGFLNAFETEEVPCVVPGRVLFIGEQVDDTAAFVAGSAAFLAEPYYPTSVTTGQGRKFSMFYRRLYDNEPVRYGQMLGMIDPAEALANVLKEVAKVAAAEADVVSAAAGEKEGRIRKITADELLVKKAINREEHGAAVLTWIKLSGELENAKYKVVIANRDKEIAETKLHQHELRAYMSYEQCTVKSIQRGLGNMLKQLDPVAITVQNLERLMAEAQIEEQYAARLNLMKRVTATIEPTILEAPSHQYHGHTLDVTTVAVARNGKIVSGSEDKSVCVWTPMSVAPDRKLEHDDAVRVVACSPAAAKENICIVGCTNGSIYLWDLDKDDDTPIKEHQRAHGGDVAITALAFSPDGKYFATGAADGSIKIWSTEDRAELYGFVPSNGVEKAHDDAVTTLAFTPQCKLISAGRDNDMRVWNLKEKGAYADGRPIVGREGKVAHLGVSRDGQWMLFDQGRSLRLTSVEKKTPVYTLNLPANSLPFETLAEFSPDGSLMLTAGAGEGRLQLWRTPDATSRGFEVRQFATKEKTPVTSAAFSADAGKGGPNSFAVSASGQKVYQWSVPTPSEVTEHRLEDVPLTMKTHSLDPGTKTTRIGFEVANPATERYPHGRFEAGRPVVIVIE